MLDLAKKHCVPCEGGVFPLAGEELEPFLKGAADWSLAEDKLSISKSFAFKNFADALAFTNKIGALAESEGHHPDITLSWGKVGISLSTHAIGGLSENDFILAAKINHLI